MNAPTRHDSLQTYQVVLYHRALHPELFHIKASRVRRTDSYELEAWCMNGAHLLRFEHKGLCACELIIDQEGNLPAAGVVTAFTCAGEHDFEHAFARDRVNYMLSVHTESLSENLYLATFEETLDLARESDALIHKWRDETGRCLSVVDVQTFAREVHIQTYHLMAQGGLVLRSQTIFEHP